MVRGSLACLVSLTQAILPAQSPPLSHRAPRCTRSSSGSCWPLALNQLPSQASLVVLGKPWMPSVDGAGMRRGASALRKVRGLWLGLPNVALTPAAQQRAAWLLMSTLAWPLRTLQAPRAFSPAVLVGLVIGGIELGRPPVWPPLFCCLQLSLSP